MSIACLECKERIAIRRGNCARCHRRLAEAIRAGRVTDPELVAQGRRQPPVKPGPKMTTLIRSMRNVPR